MGFFKDFRDDFKEDLADAIDELMPGGRGNDKDTGDVMVNTLEDDADVDSELSKLDGLLEQVEKKANGPLPYSSQVAPEPAPAPAQQPAAPITTTQRREPVKATEIPSLKKEKRVMDTNVQENSIIDRTPVTPIQTPAYTGSASDENAVITSGMTINGDLESTGSIEVEGLIKGNVSCNGKLTVTGIIRGNSTASEFFADSAKIEGEIATSGTVKVGAGSIIIGNITATSAVIAGAVKGDIDVQGPVVVDTSAVVMGNIKSRSVQINNGAVIEGFCSQAYAEIDVNSLFGGK